MDSSLSSLHSRNVGVVVVENWLKLALSTFSSGKVQAPVEHVGHKHILQRRTLVGANLLLIGSGPHPHNFVSLSLVERDAAASDRFGPGSWLE